MTYWEQRKLDALARVDEAVAQRVPEMIELFEKAKTAINEKVLSFYGRYAENNQISLETAQKLLTGPELRVFRESLKEYERLAIDAIGTFDLQVENMSVAARVTRQQALEMQVDAILQDLYQQQREGIKETVGTLYIDQYDHAQFDLSKDAGFLFEFSRPNSAAIEQVLSMPVQGADISTRLWRQDIDTGFRIRQTLGRMFVEGKPPQFFAEELQGVIGVIRRDGEITGTGKKYEAYRLLYNEAGHASGQADLQMYRDDGIEEYKILATLDTSTCGCCREMDGKVFPVAEAVEGVNYPLFHVNCRTTTIAHIPNVAKTKATRAARDPETNKTIFVPGDMTYKEWHKKYIGTK